MQGAASSSSASSRASDADLCDAAQQQPCQDSSSSDKVGGSIENNSSKESELELQDSDTGEVLEDYYFEYEDEDDYDDEDVGSDYEFSESYFSQELADKFDHLDLPPGVEATVPWLQKAINDNVHGSFKPMAEIEDEIGEKYKCFKQFDTVEDFSDHHYASKSVGKTSREWAKRIQREWKLLENGLPASIYVRVSENRMDLLRAVMVGPQGTPYHDGLFFFDAQFTSSYPSTSPVVYYHSGGLRLNPNLYACGKVCLSLLGTWDGHGCERWNSARSTMLQVLISIQALILNEKPYFNEPGFENYANSASGQRRASEYNDTTFQHSCRTMLYSLRKPPQHFEDLVAGHFCVHGPTILAACKYYMEGHKVGSVVPDDDNEGKKVAVEGSSSSSAVKPHKNKVDSLVLRASSFKTNMSVLFEELLMEFNVKGADTRKFCAQKLKKCHPATA